jgi:hypothetical protein
MANACVHIFDIQDEQAGRLIDYCKQYAPGTSIVPSRSVTSRAKKPAGSGPSRTFL